MKISELLATVNLDGGIFIGDMALVLAAAMTLVQISPINIDPWTWVARKIGRAVNGELFEKIGELDKSLANIKKTMERRDAIDARNRILRLVTNAFTNNGIQKSISMRSYATSSTTMTIVQHIRSSIMALRL